MFYKFTRLQALLWVLCSGDIRTQGVYAINELIALKKKIGELFPSSQILSFVQKAHQLDRIPERDKAVFTRAQALCKACGGEIDKPIAHEG